MSPAGGRGPVPGIGAATMNRVERAAGGLATRAVALMDERLPWFRTLPADQRSWVTLVAQAGIGGYVPWLRSSESDLRLTDTVFGTAPRDLLRAVSLRRTVELVRVAIDVAEQHVPALGATQEETVALRDGLLRYSREIAFAAAAVYAAAAETRGAWDARAEAALIDGIVRREGLESLASRAAALSWDPGGPVLVVAGSVRGSGRTAAAGVNDWARANAVTALAGVHGTRLIVVVSAWRPVGAPASKADPPARPQPPPGLELLFGEGPIVYGNAGPGLPGAVASAAEALAGLRVALAAPGLPRPASADDLLLERALAGDEPAAERMRTTVYEPLAAAASPLLESLDAYLGAGAALEPAARAVFVHPNTLRYRLHRIAELTGRDPWNPRDVAVLRSGVILGRLHAIGGGSDIDP